MKPAYFFCGHVHAEFGFKKLYNTYAFNAACTLIRIHDEKIGCNIEAITLVVDSIGKVNFERLLKLQTSDIFAHSDGYAEIVMIKLEQIKLYWQTVVQKTIL